MAQNSQKGVGIGCLTIIITILVIGVIGAFTKDDDHNQANARHNSTACGKDDLQCWGDRYSVSAGFKCSPEVERLAKYDFKWTDSWYEPKFYKFHWANTEHSAITMLGDRAKMSNGFGAFSNVIYECDMSIPEETVVDVRAEDGHLR